MMLKTDTTGTQPHDALLCLGVCKLKWVDHSLKYGYEILVNLNVRFKMKINSSMH
jgi:hypothetical protein